MYIRRAPLGQGNLTFKQRRHRYPLVLIFLYLVILFAALYVFWQADRYQPRVAAIFGPTPTATPYPEDLIRQADQAYRAGNFKNAIDLYRQASEIDPQDVETLTALSHILTLDRQLQEALVIAEQVILIAPEDPRGYAVKARALDWDGQYDKATVAALRAIELDANYAPAHAYLAEAYVDVGQLRLAREQAELAIQLDPYNVDARRNYAYVLESYGNYGGAIQQYIQALHLHPNRLDLMYGLARNYRGAKQYEQSIRTFREIMVRTPEESIIYIELGKTYFEIRDDDAAQTILEQAVRLVCEDCPLHTYREILTRGGEDGPLFLDRTDRKLPDDLNTAWLRLGQVYYTRRNYESALEILEEAIAYGEKHEQRAQVETYYITAGAYYYLDRCELAVPRAKQALDILTENKSKEPDTFALLNTLRIFVLCRDYAGSPYLLTDAGFTNGFPDGYEEPDVIVERGSSGDSSP